MTKSMPAPIVCVYAQADEASYRDLQTYLSLWQRENYIQWLEVSAGNDIEQTMQTYLQQAQFILLLISPDFFAQDHCYRAMHIALQERSRHLVPVVPVLVRASAWKESACGSLLPLPGNERPISEWVHPEQAYEEIHAGLARLLPANLRQKLLQEITRSATAPTSTRARAEAQKPGVVTQPGSMNIDVTTNNGQIGNFYAPIHNETRH